ncbi:hypothetical protein D3C73_919550 [compost metagenome]
MPYLLDIADGDRRQALDRLMPLRARRVRQGGRPHHRHGGTGQTRGQADPEPSRHQLQQRPPPLGLQRIQPALDQDGRVGAVGAKQGIDHLAQIRLPIGAMRGVTRPDQRGRLGQIAHIVIGPAKQDGIDPGLDGLADHGRLGRREAQLAGQGRQRPAAIRVGRRLQVIA